MSKDDLQARCRSIEESDEALKLDPFPMTVLICTRTGWQAECSYVRPKEFFSTPTAALDALWTEIQKRALRSLVTP